jgi:pimeloyl-ACP methyl ester carboxylesterase
VSALRVKAKSRWGCREPPEFLRKSYADISPDGPDHYQVVVEKLARMHSEGPTLETTDLERVESRTLVMVADDDEAALEHVIAMYRAFADAELAVIPGTSHGLLVEKPEPADRRAERTESRGPHRCAQRAADEAVQRHFHRVDQRPREARATLVAMEPRGSGAGAASPAATMREPTEPRRPHGRVPRT